MSISRIAAALVGGLLGAVVIWTIVPYNNYVLTNAHISDSYLPGIVLLLLSVLVLVVNPVLRRWAPRLAFVRGQLALMLGAWLVAATLPSFGLLAHLPYGLAGAVERSGTSEPVAKLHRDLALPPSLFPDDVTATGESKVVEWFLDRLPEGETIPWAAWLPPLVSWGSLLAANWLMMIGLAAVLFPQWRNRERLAFPLLDVYGSTIEDPPEGGTIAPLFKNRVFWIGALIVVGLHSFNGLNAHTSGAFPGFPLDWDLSACFREGMWRNIGWAVKAGRIYFALVGMSYLCSTRISFSIWFTVVAYALWNMIARTYLPMVSTGGEGDQRMGATAAMTLFVVWLGRRQWADVGRAMLGRGASESDSYNRRAGWMFTLGCLGIFAWYVWAGVPAAWSLLFVLITFMISIVMARIIAETGMPVLRIQGCEALGVIKLFPPGVISTAALYFSGAMEIIVHRGARIGASVMGMHALGLDKRGNPKRQWRFAYSLVAVLLVGLVICGAMHLRASYYHASPLGRASDRISGWGVGSLHYSIDQALRHARGQAMGQTAHNRGMNIGAGFAMAGGMQIACMLSPRWPLHPIGLFFGSTWYGQRVWWSVLLGWLLKVLVTRLGGARGYRAFRPFCLGLILGEAFAFVLWAVVPLVRLWLGADPAEALQMPPIM